MCMEFGSDALGLTMQRAADLPETVQSWITVRERARVRARHGLLKAERQGRRSAVTSPPVLDA